MLKDIAEGEGDLSRSLAVISKDEIGDLSDYFNQFLNRLKGIILNIKDGSEDNMKLEKQLRSSSDQTVKSIGMIKSSLDSMKERIDLLNDPHVIVTQNLRQYLRCKMRAASRHK